MPERLECEVLQKARYINTLTFLYLYLYYPAKATLVCVLLDILSAIILCVFPETDITASATSIGEKICMTVDRSSLRFGGDIFGATMRGQNGFLDNLYSTEFRLLAS